MYRFLQKHGKKLMAVFSAFLMIAFALPSASNFASGGNNAVIGRIGDAKLRLQEFVNAKRSWEMLKSIRLPGGRGQTMADSFGPVIGGQINQNPMMYLLLQKEAEAMGVTVSNDELQRMLQRPEFQQGDEARQDNIRIALHDFLVVDRAFGRAAKAIKVSDPILQREQAEMLQSITLGAVDFTTAKYADKVPAPTSEQLKAQFEKYADNPKGGVSKENPFGFGYRYPDRVKLQYIVVPKEEVRKQVEASKDAYAWRVEAQKYYIQNLAQFASTQPDKKPDDILSLGSGGAKKGPTTRPFAEVEEKIRKDIIEAATTKRMAQIADRINVTLGGDWVSYHAAVGDAPVNSPTTSSATSVANAPTTTPAPSSSLRVAYNSFDYMQKLADSIQAEFKIRPTVVQLADKWLSSDELGKVAGIGQATLGNFPAAGYIMALTAPFVPKSEEKNTDVLQVMEPTKAMHDAIDNLYVARVTEAQTAHRPVALSEVEAVVKADVITAQAYALAKADAVKLLEAARKQGLKDAAGATPVISVGPVSQRGDQAVTALALTGASATEFLVDAFKLLSTPTSRSSSEPVKLIELPRDGRVIVAELGKVEPLWTEKSLPYEQSQLRMMIANQLQAGFARDWFNFDSVKSRLKYVPDPKFQEGETHTPAPAPPPMAPPLF